MRSHDYHGNIHTMLNHYCHYVTVLVHCPVSGRTGDSCHHTDWNHNRHWYTDTLLGGTYTHTGCTYLATDRHGVRESMLRDIGMKHTHTQHNGQACQVGSTPRWSGQPVSQRPTYMSHSRAWECQGKHPRVRLK